MENNHKLTDFVIQKELGRGSFGIVFLVQNTRNRKFYVLKRINLGLLTIKQKKAALREAEILKQLDHPHIIKYHASFLEDNDLSLIMDYAEGGDLQQLLLKHRLRKKNFNEKELWRFANELCSAVSYLHSRKIIHRDIKCHNVFLTKDHSVKLGDLGASKMVSAEMQATRVGTPLYLAPEMVKQQPYDFKVDVWAIGCVLYNLASLESPFVGRNLITLGISIVNKIPKPLPSGYSKRLSELIMKLLEKKPIERPSMQETMQFLQNELTNFNSVEIDEMSTMCTLNKSIEPYYPSVSKIPNPTSCKPFTICNVPEKARFYDDREEEKIIKRPSTQPGRPRTAGLEKLLARREIASINPYISPQASQGSYYVEKVSFSNNLRHCDSEGINKKLRKDPIPIFPRKSSIPVIPLLSSSQTSISNIIDKRLDQAPVIIRATPTSVGTIKPSSPHPQQAPPGVILKPQLARPQTSQPRIALQGNFTRPKSAVSRENILFTTPALKSLVKSNAAIKLSLSQESSSIKKKPSIIDLKCL
ncbi:unnamed protein product [Blepharisma stoltei]|uniref:non-specific serine/threonine protein kinase n=1 Tax=Blepharisma stoltei TaxID=1481888 RepID=A0AAU9JY74_9CILI|nr:unnamed protein product [Blepharisma stoltei]